MLIYEHILVTLAAMAALWKIKKIKKSYNRPSFQIVL